MKYNHPYDCVRDLISVKKTRFLGVVGYSLEYSFGDTPCGTASIKGRNVTFDKKYWGCLDDHGRLYVTAHEIGHKAMLHSSRIKGYADRDLFNRAADMAVNGLLEAEFGICPILHAVTAADENLPELLSTEEYYRLLEKKQGGRGNDSGCDENGNNAPRDIEESDDDEEIEACEVAKAADSVSYGGGLSEQAVKTVQAMKTSTDWKREVLLLAKRMKRGGTSWRTPRRSRLELGYFPGPKKKPKTPELVISVDTSGSISEKFFSMIVGAVSEIAELAKCDIRLIQWGTNVVFDKVLKHDEVKDVGLVYGGGTEPSWMLDEFLKCDKDSKMVVFTDGYFRLCDTYKRAGDVLWVIDNERNTPKWGRTIRIKEGGES